MYILEGFQSLDCLPIYTLLPVDDLTPYKGTATLPDIAKATRRLINSLGFVPSHDLTIDCDNERTIGLLTSEDTAFETKLRHVDIHHHWLRQEVQEKRINVRWVATASMVADGLTKLLSKQKHEGFVRMLRMVDIGYLIA
ncbi:unnamed protein product [Penicillium camemberti]|uniref:Str. FM013 n=1 Tax=Penicillium camemberti (strain FM 013) TaxID=1429867 RepID=A0A0G4NWV4_PENC3|nr:unnamed protein product [Penicillium camemberti]